MTGTLKRVLMEHADAVPAPPIDVDAVVGAGRRRVRRARLATGLAAAAVAGAVAAGALALPGPGPNDRQVTPAGTASPFAQRKVGYAVEDVVHWGAQSFSVGAVVKSYVQTDDGFVFTTPDKGVWLYGGADSQRIGRSANGSVRADDTGSLVAWVDTAPDGAAEYVVYDTRRRAVVAREPAGTARVATSSRAGGAFAYAVDDGSVYWRVGADLVRYDVATAGSEVVSTLQGSEDDGTRAGLPRSLDDAADGVLAYPVSGPGERRIVVGRTVGDTAVRMPIGEHASLSPDGRLVAVEDGDRSGVYEAADGSDVTPRLPGYAHQVFYGWVDDDTAMTLAIKDVGATPWTADLLACDVPSGACREVAQVDVPDPAESFVVPTGDPMT